MKEFADAVGVGLAVAGVGLAVGEDGGGGVDKVGVVGLGEVEELETAMVWGA